MGILCSIIVNNNYFFKDTLLNSEENRTNKYAQNNENMFVIKIIRLAISVLFRQIKKQL